MPMDDPARPIDDAARQSALTQLRRAAEDGRLGPQELDARLARVHEARLAGELGAALAGLDPSDAGTSAVTWPVANPPLADPPVVNRPGAHPSTPTGQHNPSLPTPPGYHPDDRLSVTAGMSNEKRSGRWVIPPFVRLQAGFSTVKLDCRHAQPSSQIIDIEVGVGASSVVLVLPPGWGVNTDRLNKGIGTIKVKVPRIADPGCPTLVLHGSLGVGTLVVRGANWIERKTDKG